MLFFSKPKPEAPVPIEPRTVDTVRRARQQNIKVSDDCAATFAAIANVGKPPSASPRCGSSGTEAKNAPVKMKNPLKARRSANRIPSRQNRPVFGLKRLSE